MIPVARLPVYQHRIMTLCILLGCSGCSDFCGWHSYGCQSSLVSPNGMISRGIWGEQEDRAEASKLVIYDHEFKLRSDRLNMAGEDHVKQIAAMIHSGVQLPVVIERSMNDNSKGKHNYPVHPNPELDNQRREIIVASLNHLGIANANEMVVVAPAFAEAASGTEAENAYASGLTGSRSSGAFGGGFGGGSGGVGGFGGGGTSSDSQGADAGAIAGSNSSDFE